MGKDDYTSAGGGLKLKGVKNAGIEKHKKKKKRENKDVKGEKDETAVVVVEQREGEAERVAADGTSDIHHTQSEETDGDPGVEKSLDEAKRSLEIVHQTEAERRYEEIRRRRLNDRLAREGVKTHKERVEELNKYLSTLSEHHDMPRIGPG